MASTSRESLEHTEVSGSAQVKITILASEWGSSKGGLSTINRELAIQLAKSSSVEITFFVPQCSDEDKEEALRHNVHILKATPLTGYEELEWLSFPPKDLEIHIIVGHGVKLGRQAQVIRNSHECKWVQVVHTDPEELGMFKSYPNPISAGEKKHGDEVELCNLADLVVGIGPKLTEAFRSYLRWCRREETIFDFTPGLFDEFMSVKQVPEERKHPTVLVFGRGDTEDFEVKGFDIAARAVASLPDTQLLFFGAPYGKLEEVAQCFLDCDVPANRLKVRSYDKSRESLKRLFCEVDLVLMPSRTEGFGLTGLEALSAGLPVLVCQNSGFGEALSKVPFGSSFVINSEDSERWAAAIKKAWEKGRQSRLEEAEILRSSYERKYSWSEQSDALLFKMINLVRARLRLKIDCEVINGRGAPATTMGMGMKPHEPHSLVQDDAALLSIASNQPEEVHSSSKVGNGSIPSGDELFRMVALKYFLATDPSKPEEFNGYLQYLKELRKLLIADVQVRCLIITVEIRSLQILEDLWKDYIIGHLNKMAQKFLLPEDVLKEFGVSEVRLTTTIAEEEYRACRDFFERPVVHATCTSDDSSSNSVRSTKTASEAPERDTLRSGGWRISLGFFRMLKMYVLE